MTKSLRNIHYHCRTLFVLISVVLCTVSSTQLPCEEINVDTWNYVDEQVTCSLQRTTSIDSPGTDLIAAEEDKIGAIYFSSNKNISFLPDGPYENFTNVVAFAASACSLTSVYKSNFQNLKGLIRLDLDENQIEEIATNTFEDLTSLQFLWLSKENIFSRQLQ